MNQVSPVQPVFIGIDVACAMRKKLPICVVAAGYPLMPLGTPGHLAGLIPRGAGNREVAAAEPFREAAQRVANAIIRIADEAGWMIERIAIDAPATPPPTGRRISEKELAREGLSSFATPDKSAWADIRKKCVNHLRPGGSASTLPHANKIWMLYGFELFASLKSTLKVEVIEVYPFAIVRALLKECDHKSTEQGYGDQLAAAALHTGWEPHNLEARLKVTISGNRHDRLDAFMAAWVASLPLDRRRAFGDGKRPDDAIWVPWIGCR
jgi:predicted nuclease with RNAse H fold